MPSILKEAIDIVVGRQYEYDRVVADIYFMALLERDEETQEYIWQEAGHDGNSHLLALLAAAELEIALALPLS